MNSIIKTRFEKLYRSEHDSNVKERMLLVLNVVYDKHIPAAQVARDHRSKTWASDWLKRYREKKAYRRIKKQDKEW
ncbi:MAG TPA: hypothetical protein VLA48_05350 [Nitrososphaeraceae archaeon]|nr:hypothetical protein [Nitrososphaeraceae archaeon]